MRNKDISHAPPDIEMETQIWEAGKTGKTSNLVSNCL